MKQTKKYAASAAAAMMLLSTSAAAQEACKSYRVAPGDTLQAIAAAAYGSGTSYKMIYDSNVERIGSNPNRIEIGTLLRLPCADGTMADAEDSAEVTEILAAAPEASATAADENAPIVLITGNDFPPFTDESLPERGLFTNLVETAAHRANADAAFEVKFVNDWDAHLDTLLPVLAFDGSFPWSKPDCDNADALSAHDKNRCDNYLFSDPFYEVVDGIFARPGSGYDVALKPEELFGARFCRPEGYSTGVLDQVGLS
ncbi:MAG: LysM peptidoglycan-binding domain-containing protein, partial [Paracoccaceae bacterium]